MNCRIVGLCLALVCLALLYAAPAQAASCAAAWSCSTSYATGAQASANGHNYTMLYSRAAGCPGFNPSVDNWWRDDGVCGGTATATATTPPTATPTGATATPTSNPSSTPRSTATATTTPRPTATATSGGGGTCTAPTCTTSAIYTGGMTCSLNGHTWQAKWWIQGELPPGTTGVWQDNGACSGGGGTATPTATGPTATPTTPPSSGINPGNGVPAGVRAPYVDVMAWPTLDISTSPSLYGVFAFIQSAGCVPKVGGVLAMTDLWYKDQLNALRAKGGDMILGFGGASGIELAQACGDVASLQSAYATAISTYKAKWMDLDIEGAPLLDPAANDRRNKAIKGLGVKISYTLPVMPEGLTQGGLDLLSNAKTNGVPVSVVNLMTMDYGAYCGNMGSYATQAVNSVKTQLAGIGVSATVTSTPMIGLNDVTCETFTLADASATKGITLGFWSLNRDNGTCPGATYASGACSGISQALWAFTNALK